MAQTYPNRLAQLVGEEIERHRWSDREAGRRFGNLNHVTVRGIVSGGTESPGFATFFKLGAYFGVDAETAKHWFAEPPAEGAGKEPKLPLRSDSLALVDPNDYPPEFAAVVARMLAGMARVWAARARGEVEEQEG